MTSAEYSHDERVDDLMSLGAQLDAVARHAATIAAIAAGDTIDLHYLSSKASLLANAADGVTKDADLIAERSDDRWLHRDLAPGSGA